MFTYIVVIGSVYVQPATSVYVYGVCCMLVCWYVGPMDQSILSWACGSKALVREWRVPHSAWRVPMSESAAQCISK